ncbi:flagellar assembly protein FliW [Serpentinicella sp. ANB-PHB4]|uniref:flagellar assembly protein FliW n=1 Tax=Serpentinicella sp. ANB-PHB4 TaxID=3074076 RepID=UPI0028545C81|nr:flagellar assembly protein FliW [Serpentinicella sp. ANB-PHB4]MDR5659773.1 flagellar assembly protein FliW [Serpentinicella sp. ANB-PHB4]
MKITTKNFGEIEINEKSVIDFIDGIPGFDHLKKFVLIENPEEDMQFHWLQSVDDGDVAFVVINPFLFKPDYDFEISENTIIKLQLEDPKDVAIYSIVVVPEDLTKMTANLAAPIVINTKNKKGKQVLLDSDKYSKRHYIMEELNIVSEEVTKKEEEAL